MTVIKLDLDGLDRRKWRHTMRRLRWLAEQVEDILRIRLEAEYAGTTRKGYHVRFAVAGRLNDTERVAVQSILGSDPIREALNLYRVRQGIIPWNILFDEKRQDGKVRSQERPRRDMLKVLRGRNR